MGSKIGWIVAGVILVGILVFVGISVFSSPTYEAVNITRTMLEKVTLSVPVDTVVGKAPTTPGNAAADYSRAVKVYKTNEDQLIKANNQFNERMTIQMRKKAKDRTPVDIDSKALETLREMDSIVGNGATKATIDTYSMQPDGRYKFTPNIDPTGELQDVSRCMVFLADYYMQRKDYPQAEAVLKRTIIMGWQMEQERARYRSVSHGMGIQQLAMDYLVRLYTEMQKPELIETVDKYRRAVLEISDAYRVKLKFVWCPEPIPGDIFAMLEQDQDHAWRMEATMVLGILKFMYAKDANIMKNVNKLLDKAAASTDPLEREMARAAKDLPKDHYNQLNRLITE